MAITYCPTCNCRVVDNQCSTNCPDSPLSKLGQAIRELEAVQQEPKVVLL